MRLAVGTLAVLAAVAVFCFLGRGGSNVAMAQGDQPAAPVAEPGPGGPGPGGPGGPGRGNFDPAQFRERMLERAKEMLEVNDEDWKTIAPRLEKAFEAQMAVPRSGGMGRMFRPGGPGGRDRGPGGREAGPGGPGGPGGRPGMSPEGEALQKVLESKDATKDQILPVLKSFREVRAKKEKELQDARQALREVLTLRQEAQLVLFGILD